MLWMRGPFVLLNRAPGTWVLSGDGFATEADAWERAEFVVGAWKVVCTVEQAGRLIAGVPFDEVFPEGESSND